MGGESKHHPRRLARGVRRTAGGQCGGQSEQASAGKGQVVGPSRLG